MCFFGDLFPLNSPDRLGGEVIEDAIYTFYLVGDAVGDAVEDLVGNLLDGCGHGVNGIDGADDCGPALVAAFIFNAYALDIGNCDEVLPYLTCKAAFIEFLTEDSVCFAECFEAVTCDCAEATNAETGTREGLTVNELGGKSKCATNNTNLILIQELDGLNKCKSLLEISGKATYVMVGFNCLFALFLLYTFEDIRIDSSLCEEGNVLKLTCFISENVDKFLTDDLTLALGLGNTLEEIEEAISSINVDKVSVELILEELDNALGFIFTHKAVVNVNATELLPYSLDKESCNNGRVNTA